MNLKRNFSIMYRGYDIKSIMSHDFLLVSYNVVDCSLTLRDTIFYLVKGLDFSEGTNGAIDENSVIFTIEDRRFDYMNYVSSVVSTVDNGVLLPQLSKAKFRISLFDILKSFFEVFLLNFKNVSVRERFYYFIRLNFYKNCISNLEKNKFLSPIKAYVAFMSGERFSSILGQYYRKRGILTYGMQHGLHLSASHYKTEIPLDIFNLENFSSDFFLAWGTSMRTFFKDANMDENKVLIAGHPFYSELNVNIKTPPLRRVIVALGRRIYVAENRELLGLANTLANNGVLVSLKIHPLDDLNNYSDILVTTDIEILDVKKTVKETIEIFQPDYAIVLNSTVYYEYYMSNILTFRFGDSRDLPVGLDDKVYDYYSFIQSLKIFQDKDKAVLCREVFQMLESVFSFKKCSYNDIIN